MRRTGLKSKWSKKVAVYMSGTVRQNLVSVGAVPATSDTHFLHADCVVQMAILSIVKMGRLNW